MGACGKNQASKLVLATERSSRALTLRTDGRGHWRDGDDRALSALDGCADIDIWPTPFTNSFPIRREALAIEERRQFLMAWVFAPDLTVHPQPLARLIRCKREPYNLTALAGVPIAKSNERE